MLPSEKSIYLVGIAGGSASGKTSILRELLHHFNPSQVSFVSQDNYYLDREAQARDEHGEINFDLPTAIDRAALFGDVQKLLSGESISRREYTFNNPIAKARAMTVSPAPVVIVEGLFVYHFQELSALFDLKVYVDVRDEIKLVRRLKRDMAERGYPEEDVRYRWENHVRPCYEKYLRPYRDDCDFILANNINYRRGLEVLISHFKTKVI